MRPADQRSARRPHVGVSMIELLVSILILSFGILGMLGLQGRALSYGQISLYRSKATALTDDVLDRMRADRNRAVAGKWNTVAADLSSSITGSTLPEMELRDWKKQLEAALPAGAAAITVDATTREVEISVQWTERDAAQSQWTAKSIL
jgi:type IV pilus assembly protein PilV